MPCRRVALKDPASTSLALWASCCVRGLASVCRVLDQATCKHLRLTPWFCNDQSITPTHTLHITHHTVTPSIHLPTRPIKFPLRASSLSHCPTSRKKSLFKVSKPFLRSPHLSVILPTRRYSRHEPIGLPTYPVGYPPYHNHLLVRPLFC